MERFGFSLENSYALPLAQVIDLLADAGFCALSPAWKQDGYIKEIHRLARQRGLTLQSIHGQIRGIPALWSHDIETASPVLQDFMQAATACSEFGAPILVVHAWYGKEYTFCKEDLCFDHFETLVRHAENLGIHIAFEHLEGPEYLEALMAHFEGFDTVGFCWDSGHECCYNPGWDFLNRYGDRLIMTHLNDNLGLTDPSGRLLSTDDLHLFPGHGIINWENALGQLKSSRKQDILNLELKIRPKGDQCKLDLYSKMPLEEYFREAYQNACRVFQGYFD